MMEIRGGNYAERCTSCWTLTSFYRQLVHLFPFPLRFLAEPLLKPWYHITYQSYWSVRGLTSRHAQSRYFKRGSYSPILLLIATIHIFASTFQDKGSWYKFIKQVAPVIDAIQPHEDGPRYHPVVATVSLGSHSVFNYYQYEQEDAIASVSRGEGRIINMNPTLSLLLEPRSLIISCGDKYTSHLHGWAYFKFLYSSYSNPFS